MRSKRVDWTPPPPQSVAENSPPATPARRRWRALTAFGALTLAVWLTGCSAKPDRLSASPSITASNVTLTAAQRQNVHLYTVAPSQFRKTIETTGTVDFDND